MLAKLIILGVFGAGVFLICSDSASVKMTNVVCESYDKSWTVFHYCRLKAYSRNKTSLNINATFLQPVNSLSVRFKVLKRANGYKPFLFDVTFDACQFLRKPNNPVIKIIYNMIKEASNVNHSCPYVGLQVLSDFHRISIPLPFPGGDYLACLDFIFNGKTQCYVNVYVHITEDI
ncbi:uncharacterized protein Dsimw501_GD25335, isoform B [Drosophila simulans]|uniref:Uncharacterized protein, isoform B n=1 Tax=Drosophila simulans TaxID=7240 RepID=A0A0J9RGJ3_DROSI|nr:uncharacterized protein Dsimw501_GD25335, isoform B [Drosophila simulans]